MSESQVDVQSVEDEFVYDLEGVYDMEIKLVDALDEMSRMATNDKLSEAFASHRDETDEHVERVEEAFRAVGVEPSRRESLLADALIEEKARFDEHATDDDLRNLHYMTAGMKTERTEMTSYEGLLTLADKASLGNEVAEPLEANLGDEENLFRTLQGLATGSDLKTLWERLTGS